MNTLYRWISLASFAAVVVFATSAAHAFTDANAELKDAAADRVGVTPKTAPALRTAWVPTPAKKLDGFKPVLPPERDTTEKLAKADAPAPAKR